MPYTASQAQSGNQAIFAIKTGSSTFTTISEVVEFTQSGHANATADVTNLESTSEEFISTINKSSTYELTCNRVATDAGQLAVAASFTDKTVVGYKITLPMTAAQTTAGDAYAFTALVEEMDDLSSISSTKQVVTKIKLKVSGPVTFTGGS